MIRKLRLSGSSGVSRITGESPCSTVCSTVDEEIRFRAHIPARQSDFVDCESRAEGTRVSRALPVVDKVAVRRYSVRLASCPEDRIAACRLRFKVFNLELGEGLSSSYSTGLDEDRFDLACDHLLVEDQSDGSIVGTYRMQSGLTASAKFGFYSAQEFEFAAYECIRHHVLELGRASIDLEHRSGEVLTLLWRGIAQYARLFGLRYLIGCSSLPTQDPLLGWTLYRQLAPFLVHEELRTVPIAAFALPPVEGRAGDSVTPPKLLRTYLGVGAKICGPPAWDREFGTIDFLTLLDLEQITPSARNRFLTEGV